MRFHDLSRGHLIDARHRWAMEQTATITALMLLIAHVHGPAALDSALDRVREDNALPIV